MSRYILRKVPAGHFLFGPTPGLLRSEPGGFCFTWGGIPPQTFTSVAAFRRWFERQGHTLEILT